MLKLLTLVVLSTGVLLVLLMMVVRVEPGEPREVPASVVLIRLVPKMLAPRVRGHRVRVVVMMMLLLLQHVVLMVLLRMRMVVVLAEGIDLHLLVVHVDLVVLVLDLLLFLLMLNVLLLSKDVIDVGISDISKMYLNFLKMK